jgi:hypothetical protein
MRRTAVGTPGNVRVLPVRQEEPSVLTVIQSGSDRAALEAWCHQATVAAGRRPAAHEVVMALVRRLLADPALRADVAADLREGAGRSDVARYSAW